MSLGRLFFFGVTIGVVHSLGSFGNFLALGGEPGIQEYIHASETDDDIVQLKSVHRALL